MLMLRASQRQAFEAAALARFEDEMVAHAARYFPNHLSILGEPQARCVIRLGVRRAAPHGLTGRSDVCRYINLMWMFGSHFDGDPLLPWARATMANRSLLTPSVRLDMLARRGLAVFEETSGPGHAFLNRALLRLQQLLSRPLTSWIKGDPRARLPELLATLYPARCATIERSAFEALLAAAVDKAVCHDLEGEQPTLLLALAMFFAGSDFDTDPQHEWAVTALVQPRIGTPMQRLDRLHQAAQSHVGQWLARRL